MQTHEIVNLIVQKFGGNRVRFDCFYDDRDKSIDFVLGHNLYRVRWSVASQRLLVVLPTWFVCSEDNYSRWVEGILNNLVRNDAGEMVPR